MCEIERLIETYRCGERIERAARRRRVADSVLTLDSEIDTTLIRLCFDG
jgi:hypothetical protein